MYKTIQFTIENKVASIILNRPESMNAYNDQMGEELETVLKKISQSSEVRAVLLSGAGRIFSAGGDVGFFYKNKDKMGDQVEPMVRRVANIVKQLANLEVPVLASVHGVVAGVGISFMLAADLVIADHETQFNLAYSSIGLSPDGGATYWLPRAVGSKKAMELALLSKKISAEKAFRFGLVNWLVPECQREQEINGILTHLIHGPKGAYAEIKKLIHASIGNDLSAQLEAEIAPFCRQANSAEFREGVSAFIEKRKPNFDE